MAHPIRRSCYSRASAFLAFLLIPWVQGCSDSNSLPGVTGGESEGSGGSGETADGGDASSDGSATDGDSDGTDGGSDGTGGDPDGTGDDSATVSPALRYQVIQLRLVGSNDCFAQSGSSVALSTCGGQGQEFRAQVLSSDYLSLLANGSGQCVSASETNLTLSDCTNGPAQQFAYSGSADAGYVLTSFSQGKAVTSDLSLGDAAATIEVVVTGPADPLAVVVDERAVGWATMDAEIIVPDDAPPNGDEDTRAAAGTTGGGSWEAAKAAGFSNVVWFRPTDFEGDARADSLSALENALKGTEARIILFEAGEYDLSLQVPESVDSCEASCSNGSIYTEVGAFCNCNLVTCTMNGYQDKTRMIDLGSNKTIVGLGAGATFRHAMTRVIRNGNLIFRNLAFRDLPGDVRAWDDAMLFYPGDHVWVDHVSFSGFGRGSVVLSGTRVPDGDSFYAYRDSGWMTFSWVSIDSSEPWRCDGTEDSPYPFFTTQDPGLTFEHVHFKYGHGRNPAIDREGAHFINSAWESVTDGLDGRGSAQLRVEGCYFDGKVPIRMDDPNPPTVYAPWDAELLADKRKQVIFAEDAWSSIISDWGNRGLDVSTLNTNSVPEVPYPYGLDADPTEVLATVTAGAGIGKGGFPDCAVNLADPADYSCE